jgi:hypothetical protein
MENSVTVYWHRVAQMRTQISTSTAFITSVDLPEKGINPGAVCEATAEFAARRLAERTHRLSTPQEIEAFHTDQSARDRACRIQTEKQKERSVLALTPELAIQLGIVAPAAASSQETPHRSARNAARPVEATV